MDKKMYKTLAITLVFIFLFAGGFGLGMSKNITVGFDVDLDNQGGTPVADAPNAAVVSTSAPASQTAATTAPSQGTKPSESGQTNTAAENPTKPAAEPQNSSAMSVEEIVELYNTSVNRVKPEATTIVRNYQKLESLPEYLELPSAVQGIGSAAIKQFVKGSDEPQTWTTKEDFELGFPVSGTDYTSHMTPDMVESATCTDTGSSYQLEIKLYDDKLTSPEKGAGYAGVFNTVTADSISSVSIPGVTFNSVDVNGINGSISCTIDKATKCVTEITFRNTDILAIDAKVIVSVQAKLALASELNYTISY